jgi:sugar transferase (PEP-CTERM/EpsH1 system associated)
MNTAHHVMYVNYSLGIGGIETLILELCRRLDRTRYAPSVCVFEAGGKLQKEFEQLGVPVHVLAKAKGTDLALPVRLARLFREHKVSIVHTHNPFAWLYGCLGARLAHLPLVHTQHNSMRHPSGAHRGKWIIAEKMLSLLTGRITAVSASVADYMVQVERISRGKIDVILNGIDPAAYVRATDAAATKRGLGLQDVPLIIGNIARFYPAKDQRTLVRAFATVAAVVPGARLLLVGDGPQKAATARFAAEAGIAGKVLFLGQRRDIPELLQIMDIFVLSSVKEGLPIALLEAMAAGVPVVATDVDGNPELVRNGVTGIVVPPRSPEAMARAILRLHADRRLAGEMGSRGHQRVRDDFAFETMIHKYEHLYAQCIA